MNIAGNEKEYFDFKEEEIMEETRTFAKKEQELVDKLMRTGDNDLRECQDAMKMAKTFAICLGLHDIKGHDKEVCAEMFSAWLAMRLDPDMRKLLENI